MKLMYWQANPDEEDHRLESRVRENRMHGSEGGEDFGPSRPLSLPHTRRRIRFLAPLGYGREFGGVTEHNFLCSDFSRNLAPKRKKPSALAFNANDPVIRNEG